MFISFSKTVARFGGIRIGVGMRMSKKNAPAFIVGALVYYMLYYTLLLMWYMMLASFWLMYATVYGTIWMLKKTFKISIPLIDKLFNKIAEECNKKEGNQA